MLEGRQAGRKCSARIQAYVRVRRPELARGHLYGIGKRLREEIGSVFGVKLSRETLRPLMGGVKWGSRKPAPSPTAGRISSGLRND